MSDESAGFRALTGIGPATERELHDAGVRTWASLVAVLDALANVRGVATDALRAMRHHARELASEVVATSDAVPGAAVAEAAQAMATGAADHGATVGTATSDDGAMQAGDVTAHHHLVLDAGMVVGGRGRDVELALSTTDIDRVGDFTYDARLVGRAYGTPDDRWATLGRRSGHGHPPADVALRFADVQLPPGLHRLQLDVRVTLAAPTHAAPRLAVA